MPSIRLSTRGKLVGNLHLEAVLIAETIAKGAGHKYIKREPRANPPPKYRYYYKIPGKGIVASDDHLAAGTKIKGEHVGQKGHYEVLHHDKEKGIVKLKHDESGKVAHFKERDLHRMVQSYHKRKGTPAAKKYKRKQEAKPLKLRRPETQTAMTTPRTSKPKPEPKGPRVKASDLQTLSLADLGKGGWLAAGFVPSPEAAAELASTRDGYEHAIVKQPMGYLVAERKKIARTGTTREAAGDKTQVAFRDKSGKGVAKMDAEFVVMEADDLIASHNPLTMEEREDYPENVQERRYHEMAGEQMKVQRIAKNLEPDIVVNSNPDGVNGAPVITEDNVVLGGNGRTMAQQYAYAKEPESAQNLKEYLEATAHQFGLSPAEIQQMKKPVLVRRVKAGKNTDKLRMLGRRLNEALTQGLDPRSAEVALGKNFVTPELVSVLTAEMEPEQGLAEFLHSQSSKTFVNSLERGGIIDEMNRDEFIDQDTGLLNEDGRMRVERVLAARMIPDATLLGKMNQTTRQNIAKSMPHILRAEAAGWDLRDAMMAAVKADLAYRRQTEHKSTKTWMRQTTDERLDKDSPLAGISKDPIAKNLFLAMQERNGPKMMAAGFRDFARRAESAKEAQGITMFGMEAEEPHVALDRAFGLSPEAKQLQREAKAALAAEEASLKASFGISAEDEKRWAAAERQAKKQAKAPPPASEEPPVPENQAAMFSFRNPTLMKAVDRRLAAYAMDTIVRELRHGMTGRLNAAAASRDDLRIDGAELKKRVGDAVLYSASTDPDLARGLAQSKLTAEQLDGLIEAMADMHSAKLEKAVVWWWSHSALCKGGEKPPGTGWQPIPGGRKGGYRKHAGPGNWIYWYPGQGIHSMQRVIGGESKPAPPPRWSPQKADEEARAVDHMNEVHQANTVVDRVLTRHGAGLTPGEEREFNDYRKTIAGIKRQIGRSRDIERIASLQHRARELAGRVLDRAHKIEAKQTSIVDEDTSIPKGRELSEQQVRKLAWEAAEHTGDDLAMHMRGIVERHGPVEARKVALKLAERAKNKKHGRRDVGEHVFGAGAQRVPKITIGPRAPETRQASLF